MVSHLGQKGVKTERGLKNRIRSKKLEKISKTEKGLIGRDISKAETDRKNKKGLKAEKGLKTEKGLKKRERSEKGERSQKQRKVSKAEKGLKNRARERFQKRRRVLKTSIMYPSLAYVMY